MTNECFIRSFGNIENCKGLIPSKLLTMVVPIALTLKLMLKSSILKSFLSTVARKAIPTPIVANCYVYMTCIKSR